MTTTFPGAIDSPTNPLPGDPRNAPSLSGLITNLQDAVVALETKVGATSSAVTTSFDYKLSGITGTDKAVSKTGIETLSNKTLTAPKINVGSDATGDIYYRDSGGLFQRLAIGATNAILSVNGSSGLPEWIANPAASDASTSVKGVVEEGTQAEVDAGTAAGGTGARLFVNPSVLRARLLNTGVVDTGSSTAYAIAPSPAITAYSAYQEFTFKAVNANTTATPTLAVSGLTAKTIVNPSGTALLVGQISAGSIVKVVYDGTNFQLSSASSKIPAFEYVSTTTASAVSCVTATKTKVIEFTGLTGDSADEYLIEFELESSVSVGGANTSLMIRLNDDSSSNHYSYNLTASVSNTAGTLGTEALIANGASNIALSTTFGSIKIKASKTINGTSRRTQALVSGGDLVGAGTQSWIQNSAGTWSDVTNQLTSIQIYFLQGTGSTVTVSGIATIYKINR